MLYVTSVLVPTVLLVALVLLAGRYSDLVYRLDRAEYEADRWARRAAAMQGDRHVPQLLSPPPVHRTLPAVRRAEEEGRATA